MEHVKKGISLFTEAVAASTLMKCSFFTSIINYAGNLIRSCQLRIAA